MSQDRASAARHLRRRGITAGADQILRANGARHGLAITVMATLNARDVVVVDALAYPGFKMLALAFRLDLEPIPATSDGPDLGVLEKLCAACPSGAGDLHDAHLARLARPTWPDRAGGQPHPPDQDRSTARSAHHR
ncbi:hypothetical protein GCM10023257_11320 [Streptomyces hyderabadensis]|uniref:Uncharacterized protein n=2 Tax=Streptomyces hyderabadensis TaxID=598549 RepID=A0ABP9HQV5_9ACTN